MAKEKKTLKPKIVCPCCGSEKKHVYKVPGHPELKAGSIEIHAVKFEGVTITRLVSCEECGNVYDSVVAKKFVGGSHKKKSKGGADDWLKS